MRPCLGQSASTSGNTISLLPWSPDVVADSFAIARELRSIRRQVIVLCTAVALANAAALLRMRHGFAATVMTVVALVIVAHLRRVMRELLVKARSRA